MPSLFPVSSAPVSSLLTDGSSIEELIEQSISFNQDVTVQYIGRVAVNDFLNLVQILVN